MKRTAYALLLGTGVVVSSMTHMYAGDGARKASQSSLVSSSAASSSSSSSSSASSPSFSNPVSSDKGKREAKKSVTSPDYECAGCNFVHGMSEGRFAAVFDDYVLVGALKEFSGKKGLKKIQMKGVAAVDSVGSSLLLCSKKNITLVNTEEIDDVQVYPLPKDCAPISLARFAASGNRFLATDRCKKIMERNLVKTTTYNVPTIADCPYLDGIEIYKEDRNICLFTDRKANNTFCVYGDGFSKAYTTISIPGGVPQFAPTYNRLALGHTEDYSLYTPAKFYQRTTQEAYRVLLKDRMEVITYYCDVGYSIKNGHGSCSDERSCGAVSLAVQKNYENKDSLLLRNSDFQTTYTFKDGVIEAPLYGDNRFTTSIAVAEDANAKYRAVTSQAVDKDAPVDKDARVLRIYSEKKAGK